MNTQVIYIKFTTVPIYDLFIVYIQDWTLSKQHIGTSQGETEYIVDKGHGVVVGLSYFNSF